MLLTRQLLKQELTRLKGFKVIRGRPKSKSSKDFLEQLSVNKEVQKRNL
jgi:hypothetical protein